MAGHASFSRRPPALGASHPRLASPFAPPPPRLPDGPCCYKDLDKGNESQTCGCRTFWHKPPSQSQAAATAGLPPFEALFCYCGHHACYHEDKKPSLQNSQHLAPLDHRSAHCSQQSYVPAAQAARTPRPPSLAAEGLGLYRTLHPRSHHNTQSLSKSYSPLGLPPIPSYDSRPPSDTASNVGDGPRATPSRAFADQVTQQLHLRGLAQLQAAHAAVSQPADDGALSATEVATPSQTGTPELFRADAALAQTRGCIDELSKDLVKQHATYLAHDEHQVPLAFAGAEYNHLPDHQDQEHNRAPLVDRLLSHVQELKHILTRRPSILSSLSDLDKRMDALETMSFSHAPVGEIADHMEQLDMRLLEIEGKVDELEKFKSAKENDDQDAVERAALRLRELESLDGSFAHDEGHPGSARLRPGPIQRLRDLEQRLADLERSGSPCPSTPWNVEVVLLPWGADLAGVWLSEDQASQGSRGPALDSPESRPPSVRAPSDSRSASLSILGSEWAGIGGELRYARACSATAGAGGRIYNRLLSRGFVRNVPITGHDARSIHAAICNSFGDLLQRHKSDSNILAHLGNNLYGLQSSFVPLRKVHKSARLRFLSTPELASPLLWTADFLDADVFMHQPSQGLRRLFITTPDAYLQQVSGGWSWQKLRELPRFDPADLAAQTSFGSGPSEVLEGDANEPCWELDERLDPAPSVNSSFTSNDSFQKHGSFASAHPLSPEQTHRSLDSAGRSSTAGLGLAHGEQDADSNTDEDEGPEIESSRERYIAPITPISELAPATMRRTVSLPLTQHSFTHSERSRRQTASFEHAAAASASVTVAKLSQIKRRRASRSPDAVSAVRGRWNLTPRYSREPASPSAPFSSEPAQPLAVSKRQITPSAYATPFSNSFAAIQGTEWDGGDTDMDSSSEEEGEYYPQRASQAELDGEFEQDDVTDKDFDDAVMAEEEAWEGVDEGASGRELERLDEEDEEEEENESDDEARDMDESQ